MQLVYSRPDMLFAPSWANYAAKDRDGIWCWFEDVPWCHHELGRWFPSAAGKWTAIKGYVQSSDEVHWISSLIEVNHADRR